MHAIHAVLPPGLTQPTEPVKPTVKTWNRFEVLTETSEQEFPLMDGDFKMVEPKKRMKMPRFQKPRVNARLPGNPVRAFGAPGPMAEFCRG